MDRETRVEAMNRLRGETRWVEATEFRVAEIKRHRAARMKRAEARQLAWEAMLIKYPPLPRYVDETGNPCWGYPEGDGPEFDVEQLVLEWAEEFCPELSARAATALEDAVKQALESVTRGDWAGVG